LPPPYYIEKRIGATAVLNSYITGMGNWWPEYHFSLARSLHFNLAYKNINPRTKISKKYDIFVFILFVMTLTIIGIFKIASIIL